MTKSKSVAFLTLGCKVNSYETDAMQKLFEDSGYQIVNFNEVSDVYVINTCTVTNIADRKSRQMLHRARKMNENAIVVAVGCYVQAAGEVLEQDQAVDIIIGNNKKKDIVQIIHEYEITHQNEIIQDHEIMNQNESMLMHGIIHSYDRQNSFLTDTVIDLSKDTEYEELSIESVSEKTRAYIKIQDGCNQFCSYCIIPYARGRVRSRAEEAVYDEVMNLVSKGFKEIVLTGIHLSSYGIDFNDKNERTPHLLSLIVKLSKIDGLERIRLGSLEPRIITEEFAKTLSGISKFCPHFHLSLQSGSNETLQRMNRKYTVEEYYEKCQLLRKYFDNPAITTDVIVGFPGETEEEFNTTKAFLEKVAFAQMHIFKYSVRKGTKAETMPNQVKEEIKTKRSNILIELEAHLRQEYQNLFLGKVERILVEESLTVGGKDYFVGHNERYLKLAVTSDKDISNEIIQAKVIGQIDKEIMFCEIMD